MKVDVLDLPIEFFTQAVKAFCEAEVAKTFPLDSRWLVVGSPGDSAYCKTGAAFVTFASSVKQEGEPVSTRPNLRESLDFFETSFLEYLKNHQGETLYWRQLPVIELEGNRWVIYARLVLDKREEK